MRAKPGEHSSSLIRHLPAGSGEGRSHPLAGLFERGELVRHPQVCVRPLLRGQTGRQWFWVLLPKQKACPEPLPKEASPAGAKPGNTEKHVDMKVKWTSAMRESACRGCGVCPRLARVMLAEEFVATLRTLVTEVHVQSNAPVQQRAAQRTVRCNRLFGGRARSSRRAMARPYYRLPLARLWVTQSIWQLSAELPPPLLHAETWSASISANFHILLLLAAWPTAQS